MWAVSWSRISPSMMMSGSCRSRALRALAKVMPIFSWVWVWVMPSRWYSMGSSTVEMLSLFLSSWRIEE